jgi:hypothetical protein
MQGEHTCGKGLAARSALPATVARLVAALGDVLDVHVTALDAGDARSREEHAAYARLAAAYRDVAAELSAAARDMAGQADLPMGRHDLATMSGARARDAFAAFVAAEEELLALLGPALERDREMLALMERTLAPRGR